MEFPRLTDHLPLAVGVILSSIKPDLLSLKKQTDFDVNVN